jgi:hypothetical protein
MVTKQAKQEDKQDAILQLRASLGRWQLDTTYVTVKELSESPYLDSRKYEVVEERASYQKPLKYHIDVSQLRAKIQMFQQVGLKLIAPQFPELQEFFRNGKPITMMDIFEDAMDEMGAVEKEDTRTGLEFLMDNWK